MAVTYTADDLVAHAVQSMTAAGLDPAARHDPVPFRVGGFEAFVRPMTACERARLYGWILSVGDWENHPDRLWVVCSLTLCDADGELLYDVNNIPELRDRVDEATVSAAAAWAHRVNRW